MITIPRPGPGSEGGGCGGDCPGDPWPSPLLTTSDPNNENLADFYDHMMTFSNETETVTCCRMDNSSVAVSCGLGLSCDALCLAQHASLCPSGDCLDCKAFKEDGRRSCVGQGSSSKCSRCVKDGCRIKRSPGCCFHPSCRRRRRRQCAWLQKYIGEMEAPPAPRGLLSEARENPPRPVELCLPADSYSRDNGQLWQDCVLSRYK